jgi:hypothetical protein
MATGSTIKNRHAARIDGNQPDLVKQIRALGASVQHIHTVGRGVPDLLVGHRGTNYLLEVKDPAQPPSKRKLTEPEALWHSDWRGQVSIVETIEDFIALVDTHPAPVLE